MAIQRMCDRCGLAMPNLDDEFVELQVVRVAGISRNTDINGEFCGLGCALTSLTDLAATRAR